MHSFQYFEPWKDYTHPLVQQLVFTLASPNLIHYFPTEIELNQNIKFHSTDLWLDFYLDYRPRLQYLDNQPQELINFINKIKSTRLGLRFEALLWFWLNDPDNQHFQLLGHSIQNHQRGFTLGEIDFLVKNKHTQQIEHWEVCLKYYLAEENLQFNSWIGLNSNDTLQHKLNHLIKKQFQFKFALNFNIDQRFAIIKGQFYLPEKHTIIPSWVNLQRRLGQWLTFPPNTENWRRLTRQEWLCPFTLNNNSDFLKIKWWNNGIYYNSQQELFLMLRLDNHKPYPYL